ncbi:Translin [Thermosphaera aggregans DSM 11486]|uniref:Translin n=1 Tax=Thermosphaera aggregans (strain DSM 11486 / M11TL) TaxID=633148 RepID=D5U2H2_THEAM|nr:Translin [Thermosphaera aggregans DSM 11486]
MSVLRRDIETVSKILDEKDRVREEAIRFVREIVRMSGDLVSSLHGKNVEDAGKIMASLRVRKTEFLSLLSKHPDLLYSGLSYNALSEYAESIIVYHLVVEGRMPLLEEIDVPVPAYLQGLGDAVGELRRHIVELLDSGRVEEATYYFRIMEAIYESLKRLDYPDAITPGLRHKVDVAARLVEDTRVLILTTKNSLRMLKNY